MLYRMSPEQAAMFKHLSATSWRDTDPTIKKFTRKLIEDKDSSKAISTFASETLGWAGQISTSQLIAFLSGGYAARDMNKQSGGFTSFMCCPRSSKTARNPEEERNAIHSMFGDTTLDDKTIKLFAKLDFFLGGTYNEVEEQLRTTVEFLNLLTCKGGIAAKGYTHGLRFLLNNCPIFQEVIASSPLFCVRYIYMLDCIFQKIVTDLGKYYQDKNPIRNAKPELKYSQVRRLDVLMAGFEVSSVPNLQLPSYLTTITSDSSQVMGDLPATGLRRPPPRKKDANSPSWWSKNPWPKETWMIPPGKSYANFFDIRKENLRKNVHSWPLTKHHQLGAQQPLCAKYQALGQCKARCCLAYAAPDKLPPSVKAAAAKRFPKIYSS
jgi:hypothetical protein